MIDLAGTSLSPSSDSAPGSSGRDVLVVGAGRQEARLVGLLSARDDVRRIYLTPGGAGHGNGKTQAVPIPPDQAERLLAFALRRRVSLVVEGAAGGGVCDRLRALHSYLHLRASSDDPVAAAVWKRLPGGGSSPWRIAIPPPPAEPHTPYVPLSHDCERDRGYVFRLGPQEPSS